MTAVAPRQINGDKQGPAPRKAPIDSRKGPKGPVRIDPSKFASEDDVPRLAAQQTLPKIFASDLVETYENLSNERQWRIEGVIEGEPLVLWCGAEKSGKSWILMQMAAAVASGKPWLGRFACKKPGRVVYLDTEYGPYEFVRRMARVSRGMGLDPRAVLSQILYADDPSIRLCGVLLHTPEDRKKPQAKPFIDFVVALSKLPDDDVALVILDPLRNILHGGENDAQTITSAGVALTSVRSHARAPVVCAHHLNKSGGFSGSRALMGRFDLLIEGTDDPEPWYSARGRTLRHKDPIAQQFQIAVSHTNDDDDLCASTEMTIQFEGEGTKDGKSRTKLASNISALLQKSGKPLSVRRLRELTNRSNTSVTKALNELKSGGLAECDAKGWSSSFVGLFSDEGHSK